MYINENDTDHVEINRAMLTLLNLPENIINKLNLKYKKENADTDHLFLHTDNITENIEKDEVNVPKELLSESPLSLNKYLNKTNKDNKNKKRLIHYGNNNDITDKHIKSNKANKKKNSIITSGISSENDDNEMEFVHENEKQYDNSDNFKINDAILPTKIQEKNVISSISNIVEDNKKHKSMDIGNNKHVEIKKEILNDVDTIEKSNIENNNDHRNHMEEHKLVENNTNKLEVEPDDIIFNLDEEGVYELEKILDKKKKRSKNGKSKTFYLVKWKGYSDLHNTWEPAKNIPAFIIRYYERLQKTKDNKINEKEEQKNEQKK